MSPGITLSLHWWRGIGGDLMQGDLFMTRVRLGFATLQIESDDWLPRFRKMRAEIQKAITIAEKR
jgi:hypothetical protein